MVRQLKAWLGGSALVLSMVPWTAQGQDFVSQSLRIQLDAKSSRKPPTDKEAQKQYFEHWKTACTRLGKSLAAQGGPWGFGIFNGYSCYRGTTRVAGRGDDTNWILNVIDGAGSFSLTLRRDGKEVAKLVLPPSDASLAFFFDDEFVDLVAFTLLDPLPAAMVVTKSMVKGAPPRFVGRHPKAGRSRGFKYDVPEEPETLAIYRLRLDEKLARWSSQVVGAAQRREVRKPSVRTRGKSRVMVGGEVEYETTEDVTVALQSGPLWAHDDSGPAFYGFESVSLTPGQLESPEAGETKISGIQYSTGYTGGGLAISW